MLQYHTPLSYQPPVSPDTRAQATNAMRRGAPMSFGQNAMDVYNGAASSNIANYSRAADMANMDYSVAHQKAQRELALGGLRQMADAQQSQTQLQNTLASSLLGGLFR
jgi:hypothetical protein